MLQLKKILSRNKYTQPSKFSNSIEINPDWYEELLEIKYKYDAIQDKKIEFAQSLHEVITNLQLENQELKTELAFYKNKDYDKLES